jgi:hypothetical protein
MYPPRQPRKRRYDPSPTDYAVHRAVAVVVLLCVIAVAVAGCVG